MSVTIDATASASQSATDASVAITIAQGANYLVLGGTADYNTTGLKTLVNGSTTGITNLYSNIGDCALVYEVLASPPKGSVTIATQSNTSRHLGVMGVSLKGVDLTTPYATDASIFSTGGVSSASTDHIMDVTLSGAQIGEQVIGMGNINWSTTGVLHQWPGTLWVDGLARVSSYADGTIAGMQYYSTIASSGTAWDFFAQAFKAQAEGPSRSIEYFHDIYDPDGRIFDARGQPVLPWDLKPNKWIKVTGLFPPSSKRYSSFVQDPELAYIEEVSFGIRGGLRIKTSRGELTEVLLARAAGGKTL